MPAPSPGASLLIRRAVFDASGAYRYSLIREWNGARPRVVFLMLNPSTADADQDDPTIRRCVGFARSWGYASLEVVNLFAYRVSYPRLLRTVPDPIGPQNDDYLIAAARRADLTIVAWGNHGKLLGRDRHVADLLMGVTHLYCLSLTGAGHPRHPLRTRASLTPVVYPAIIREQRKSERRYLESLSRRQAGNRLPVP